MYPNFKIICDFQLRYSELSLTLKQIFNVDNNSFRVGTNMIIDKYI